MGLSTRCPDCDQPMLPQGEIKRPHEYDHANGCPRDPSATAGELGERAQERPIIFSGAMVRAILDERKTQTRRVVRGHPHTMEPLNIGCPYGVPGDRLWVRETWGQTEQGDEWGYYRGKADARLPVLFRADDPTGGDDDEYWRPSIHMPRWASRITLEVIGVRVERVQDISEDDARAEGVTPTAPLGKTGHAVGAEYAAAFAALWDSINGKRAPWASNPWVWAVEFQRVGGCKT